MASCTASISSWTSPRSAIRQGSTCSLCSRRRSWPRSHSAMRGTGCRRTDPVAVTSVSVTLFALDHYFGADLRTVVDVARIAEGAGLDHLALPDHVVMGRGTDTYP